MHNVTHLPAGKFESQFHGREVSSRPQQFLCDEWSDTLSLEKSVRTLLRELPDTRLLIDTAIKRRLFNELQADKEQVYDLFGIGNRQKSLESVAISASVCKSWNARTTRVQCTTRPARTGSVNKL
jgi:hypothetical protein